MIFTSVQFAIFFAIVYSLYRFLPHRAQNWLLLLASYVFYAAWDWRFLSLLIGSTLIDFSLARYISRIEAPGRRATNAHGSTLTHWQISFLCACARHDFPSALRHGRCRQAARFHLAD